VSAAKWKWNFRYPNGYDDDNLHVPVDEPIRLTMTSKDVIHSLFVPAFRIKQDVVPGRYTQAWFRATAPGEYDLECTEYCGTEHSEMVAKVIVHPQGEFEQWLEEAQRKAQNLPPAERGRNLYLKRGCSACHSTDGTTKQGPSFLGIYGHPVKLATGQEVMVDDNYIRESIVNPSAKIVAGFEDRMNPYQGLLSDDDITAIIAYLKTLK
jgi:cytochrome c oxidase subunit 2